MAATKKVLEFTQSHRDLILSTGFAILRPVEGEVHPAYLRHWLSSEIFQVTKDRLCTGATQKAITNEKMSLLTIPLPQRFNDQVRIAEILDKADALRAKRRAVLAKLDSLIQSIFFDMFYADSSEMKRWPVCELQKVVKEGTIVTYGIVQAGDEFPGGIAYIRTGDIVNGEIVREGLRHTDPAIAAKFERSRVQAGDIVMSIRATVGTTALVPDELDGANLTQGTARISPGDRTENLYLLNFLRSPLAQHWISMQIKGATFREITLARLRELPVILPPKPLQKEFVRRLQIVNRLRAWQESSAAGCESLFASLQQRAFRGEL
jgi:type I restriction enzyme S subunit